MTMSNQAHQMYALSLDQCVAGIKAVGHLRTILLQGDMGGGKTSTMITLAADLPTHVACYFDCTTKDIGDLNLPNMAVMNEQGYVTMVPNEELGAHLGKPIILMIDELGTTNKGSEGVGDILPPHARNRVSVVQVRKSTNMDWIEWGINAGIDHSLLGWCKDNPHLFAPFEDVKDPDENPYIFHPKQQRAAFVTPRSLHAASDILHQRHAFDEQTLTSLLMGTIGDRGAMDLDGLHAASRHRSTRYVRQWRACPQVFKAFYGDAEQEIHQVGYG